MSTPRGRTWQWYIAYHWVKTFLFLHIFIHLSTMMVFFNYSLVVLGPTKIPWLFINSPSDSCHSCLPSTAHVLRYWELAGQYSISGVDSVIILPFPAGQWLKIDHCVGNITMPWFWVSNKAMPHLFPDFFRMTDDSAHTLLLSLSFSLLLSSSSSSSSSSLLLLLLLLLFLKACSVLTLWTLMESSWHQLL